ncbi:LPS assembly lipoprotein LptE [Vulcaniibacterium tengchongense]|uniref:LPS-assembly lipoprotein LptE n=1 Tax=Vulcaniibacterium tengchongense TaxID=1273429 RepID=A0A3N4V1Z4_9GAMM|nr:LPS assembly lipoprotein LptE [Vulcaniibacterium tengchongense]RPE76982.1 LPS-assembly lipoprotein [Vulcaniibacterium tengchongense]
MTRLSFPRSFRLLAPAALALLLCACGFRLREALVLPPDLGPVRVVSVDRYSPLATSLAQALTRAGAVPANEDTADAAVLDILAERWGDLPISLDELGRAQEYTLRYAVTFELRKGDGSVLVPRQTIELGRDYVSNPVQALGTEGEREILQGEMRREMAASVLRRIDAVARRQGQAGAAAADVPAPAGAPAAPAEGGGAPR